MSVYLQLIELYSRYGFHVRTGLYPPHFHNFIGAAGTLLEKDSIKLRTGGGIGLGEVYFFEELCAVVRPTSIFIIGNAFGWSAFAFALARPQAEIVALDAGVEGIDNMAGIDLTNLMARNEIMQVNCIFGFSPQDVGKTISNEMTRLPDLVFIDGLHTNKQLIQDFEATYNIVPEALYLFHDIVTCGMQKSFSYISSKIADSHESYILWRTSSGIGISVPRHKIQACQLVLSGYTDDRQYIETTRLRWRLLQIKSMLGVFGSLIDLITTPFDRSLQVITNRLSRHSKARRSA